MLEAYQSENRTRPVINYFQDTKAHSEFNKSASDVDIEKESRVLKGLCMNLNCRQNSLLDPLKAIKGLFCEECHKQMEEA